MEAPGCCDGVVAQCNGCSGFRDWLSQFEWYESLAQKRNAIAALFAGILVRRGPPWGCGGGFFFLLSATWPNIK